MAKVRRVIKKIERPAAVGFDEQLWPVNLALLVLTGFVAGVIISKSSFEDPRLFYNGWARLGSLGVTSLGLLVLAYFFSNRQVARRLQLGVTISALLHLVLVVMMAHWYLPFPVPPEDSKRGLVVQLEELPKLPEYFAPNPQQPTPEHERPVETESPQKEPETAQERPTPEPREVEKQPQPQELPQPDPQVQPSTIPLQKPAVSAPRRAESTSQLSKQTAMAPAQTSTPTEAPPQEQAQANRPAAEVAANAASIKRPENSARVPRQAAPQPPQTVEVKDNPRLANRAATTAEAKPSTAATLPKQTAEAAQTPRADAPRELAAKPLQPTQPKQPAPAATMVERTPAASPVRSRQPTEPSRDAAVEIAKADAPRQQPAEHRPTIARTQESSPNKQRVETSIANSAPVVPNQAATTERTASATPSPTRNELTRQATAADAPRVQAAPAPLPTTTAAASASPAVAARAPANSVPTSKPEQAPTAQPQRATQAADVAATPAAAVGSSATAQANRQPSLAPSANQVERGATTATSTRATAQSASPDISATSSSIGTAGVSRTARGAAQPTVNNNPNTAPTRQATTATAAAQAATDTPASVAANSPTPRAVPSPQGSDVARQAASAPTSTAAARPTTSTPGASLSTATATALTRGAAAADAPSIAPAAAPARPRQADAAATVASTPVDQPASPGTATAAVRAPGSPAPASTTTARSDAGGPQVTRSTSTAPATTSGATAGSTSAQRAAASAARNANAVSLTPSGAPAAQPRRAAEVGVLATSPQNIESPAVEAAANGNTPSAQASSSALTRAESGLVGGGRSPNADVSLPASQQNSAPFAAAAATRAAASQREAGPALAPSEPSQIAKGRAGGDAPAAILKSQAAVDADAPGVRQPGEVTLSASAAVERNAASAPTSRITAAAGNLTIDTGTTQIVPEAGTGRASGGGQPTLAAGSPDATVARSQPGGAPLGTIATTVEAPLTAAPDATGGGAPAGPAANVGATAAATRETGAAKPAAAAGSAADTSPATSVNAAQLAKAEGVGAAAQPDARLAASGQPVARAPAGIPSLATLNADTATPLASAPAETGGGSPAGPQPSAVADAGPQNTGTVQFAQAGKVEPSGVAPAAGGMTAQPAAIPLARADGGAAGGESALSGATAATTIARASGGSASLNQLTAAAVAPSPVAPPGDGGGAPPGEFASTAEAASGERSTAPMTLTVAQVSGAPPAASGGTAGEVASAAITRASATEAVPGAVAGGGTEQPARGKGAAVALLTQAEVPQIESTPQAGGAEPGEPLPSQGAEAQRAASGLPGRLATGPAGALAGPTATDTATLGSPGIGSAVEKAATGVASSPTLGAGSETALPLRKGDAAALPGGQAAEIEQLELAAVTPAEGVGSGLAAAPEAGEDAPSRIPGAVPVRVLANAGPGGLGEMPSPEVGIPDRRAQRDSLVVKNEPAKFLLKSEGGAAPISGKARDIAPSFSRRAQRQKEAGGDPQLAKTEETIERGVDFLARHQMEDGRWSFHRYGLGIRGYENERASIQADTAATGLALLAFLGAGYDHYDDKYQNHVAAGIEFLLKHQQPDGNLYIAQNEESNQVAALYSHGIASIALCEAFGMTGDPRLGVAAQKALDYIVASQHKVRGGWRYAPNFSSDLSVTGWQLMALKSGELAGLTVPAESYERVGKFLDKCQGAEDGSLYVYNPYAPEEQKHGRNSSTVMTAVGLLMRQYTGWNRDREVMRRGADHLLKNMPTYGTSSAIAHTGTVQNPLRDTYYWYYATQVMFHMKGDYWKQWNTRLHPLLIQTQLPSGRFAGSWDPLRPIPDKWGQQGGRIYLTAMNLLSLEVFYRHLPIYENTAK